MINVPKEKRANYINKNSHARLQQHIWLYPLETSIHHNIALSSEGRIEIKDIRCQIFLGGYPMKTKLPLEHSNKTKSVAKAL